jgi:hypothetical protein
MGLPSPSPVGAHSQLGPIPPSWHALRFWVVSSLTWPSSPRRTPHASSASPASLPAETRHSHQRTCRFTPIALRVSPEMAPETKMLALVARHFLPACISSGSNSKMPQLVPYWTGAIAWHTPPPSKGFQALTAIRALAKLGGCLRLLLRLGPLFGCARAAIVCAHRTIFRASGIGAMGGIGGAVYLPWRSVRRRGSLGLYHCRRCGL